MTLKSKVSQQFSAVRKGFDRIFLHNQIKDEAAAAAYVKHKCYSLTTMMYYLKRCIHKKKKTIRNHFELHSVAVSTAVNYLSDIGLGKLHSYQHFIECRSLLSAVKRGDITFGSVHLTVHLSVHQSTPSDFLFIMTVYLPVIGAF